MPYHMAHALGEQGIDIVPISSTNTAKARRPVQQRLSNHYKRKTSDRFRRTLDTIGAPITRALVRRAAKAQSRTVQSNLLLLHESGQHLDAIFGCNISKALVSLDTELPIIYASDATGPMIIPNYPKLASRGSPFRETLIETERTGVQRANAAIFASPIARESAINDLGIDQARTHVVPMGAHVTPDDPSTITAPASPPSRDNCQLLIVAADPVRKRVDLALKTTELLRARAINTTLHIVGPGTQSSNASPVANPIGRLKLSDPNDRATHQRHLHDCHLQLLPSLGEAFGIAPIESAHFARPSIVAGAGGLPFVVQHEKTGIVVNPESDAQAWADAIESLIDEPDRYRAMSTAALQRARNELNWDAWGRAVAQIITQTISAHR